MLSGLEKTSMAVSALGALALMTAEPVSAERKVLTKPRHRIEKAAEVFTIESDPASGNYLIRYQADGDPVSVLFEPATKVEVVVEASVDFDSAAGVYTYGYRLASLPTSRQRAYSLTIEYAPVVFDVTGPEEWYALPLSFRSALAWADGKADRLGMAPGSSQSGFGFKAAGIPSTERFDRYLGGEKGFFFQGGSLPGLVQCLVRGYVKTLEFPLEPPKGVMDALPRPFDDAVAGLTVGPVALPDDFRPGRFLSRIRVFNQRSLEQGWIADAGTAGLLETKLSEAQVALDQDNRILAKGRLNNILSTLASLEGEESLSSEAFALLKYNIQHLESKL